MTGLVVVEINPTGQAAKLGIRQHDVLFRYNGIDLNVIDDITKARDVKVENELIVIRGRELIPFMVAGGALGVSLVPYPIPDASIDGVGEVLARFLNEADMQTEIQKQEIEKQKQADKLEQQERISSIPVTTIHQLDGYRITKTLNIITAEYVGGVNLFRDFLTGVTDLIGGRSGTMQNELRKARETCLADLKIEADRMGANAVIGVDLDYSEISGGGKSMLFLVATGTAVIIQKI